MAAVDTSTLTLTEKQAEVYRLLVEGKDVPVVAEALGVSNGAVYSHIKRIRANHPDVLTDWAHLGTGGRGQVRAGAAPAATPNGAAGLTDVRQSIEAAQRRIEGRLVAIDEEIESLRAEKKQLGTEQTRLTKLHELAAGE